MTIEQPPFLPTSRKEMDALGWDALDALIVSGDAYVDHPSFGSALLGRWLTSRGFRVGIVAQPRWDVPDDVARMGRPALFAGVTAGALDSMLAHYTAFRKKRRDDPYSAGGRAGLRPNRACIVYTALVRHAFPGLPVLIGGIEASMRRASHYDFWSDSIRRSILPDSKADLLVYGMGERAVLEAALRLSGRAGHRGRSLHGIPGTAFMLKSAAELPADAEILVLPSHEELARDPRLLVKAALIAERHVHSGKKWMTQAVGGRTIAFAPPAPPLSPSELDCLHSLPFARRAHPSCREPVPADKMIRFSVTSHRGCAGGCAFCALALHQGRRVSSRGSRSIMEEIAAFASDPAWDGSVTNIGGPTANMWGASCGGNPSECERSSCLWPRPCRNFRHDQSGLARLLRAAAALPSVKHVRIAGGIRYDLAMSDETYMNALIGEFTGGQLTVAPEHCADSVLDLIRKPAFDVFEAFLRRFEQISRAAGKEQYVVPYLMSALPGCTDSDMRKLAAWLRRRNWRPQQVQCFIPTPGTLASAMFCSGTDTAGKRIHVARSDAERLRQHGILLSRSRTPARQPRRGGVR